MASLSEPSQPQLYCAKIGVPDRSLSQSESLKIRTSKFLVFIESVDGRILSLLCRMFGRGPPLSEMMMITATPK